MNLAAAVWKLLRLRIVIFVSGFRRASLRRKIGMIILLLIVLGFAAAAFFISWMILSFLHSPKLAAYVGDVKPFLESIPTLLVGAAFIGIFLTSFGVLLQALYLAGDMDFLLSTPLPIRAVFVSKLLQAILPNFALICLFALPVLFGLGAGGGYNLLYYVTGPFLLASLALAAAGISALLVMLVVRIFPARRVAEVISFVGGVSALICSQSGQLANYADFSSTRTPQALSFVSRFDSPFSPFTWAGQGLVRLGQGDWLPGLGLLALIFVLCAGIFYGSLSAAERLYYSGWASMQGVIRRKKAPRTVQRRTPAGGRSALLERLTGLVQPAIRAMVVKDFLVMRRDLRNLSQLISPLIFGIIYAFMLVRTGGAVPAGKGEAPAWFMTGMGYAFSYGQVALSIFIGWTLLSRLAMIAFSQEGKNYWMLKSAPLSAGQLLMSKYLVAYLPPLALGWLFLVALALVQRSSIAVAWYTFPVVALILAGLAGIILAFGVMGVRLDWQDPRHMNSASAGCLSAPASMLYLGVSLLLFIGPPIAAGFFAAPLILGQMAGLAAGGVFALVCAILPLWLVRNRVPKIGEA